MDKRTILAFILIGLVLIFTQTKYYKSKVMTRRVPSPVATQSIPADSVKHKPVPSPRKHTYPQIEKKQIMPLTEQSKLQSLRARNITVETELFTVVLSTRGGKIISFKLKKYRDAKGAPAELILSSLGNSPGIQYVTYEDTIRFNNAIFELQNLSDSSVSRLATSTRKPRVEISFVLPFGEGKSIQKRYVFYHDRYDFDFEARLSGISSEVANRSYQIVWDSGLAPTEHKISEDARYAKIYSYLGKELEEFNINPKGKKEKHISGQLKWAAIRSKYFVVAVIPQENHGRGVDMWGQGVPIGDRDFYKHYGFNIQMSLSDAPVHAERFTVYLGPVDYYQIKKLRVNLEKIIMSSGWYERLFRPFSIAILLSFRFFHNFISNYGLIIVVFSILIKVITYPLTKKSYVSMKKMQLIQPQMTALREKFKNDPQRLQREMIKLYKEYGVNPMSGCLPMLLQMPLLIGLFIVFRSTIELRGAKFILWIKDLSRPDTIAHLPFAIPMYGDTINVLPLLMGLTMYFQQKATMQDPRQKMMAYFMPIFFVLLFNSFPSGLTLYYTLFNLFTIVQQRLLRDGSLQPKPVETKAKGKRGKRG